LSQVKNTNDAKQMLCMRKKTIIIKLALLINMLNQNDIIFFEKIRLLRYI